MPNSKAGGPRLRAPVTGPYYGPLLRASVTGPCYGPLMAFYKWAEGAFVKFADRRSIGRRSNSQGFQKPQHFGHESGNKDTFEYDGTIF